MLSALDVSLEKLTVAMLVMIFPDLTQLTLSLGYLQASVTGAHS